MNVIKNLCPENKFAIKCPYKMTPIGVCIHNTANDASARNEVAYMIKNNNQTSFHVAIDDKEIVQGIRFDRNAWHAGDGGSGVGNRKYISIEICYSKSGGERFALAMQKAAEYTAELLRQYGWTIDNVKKHQDFSGKYCPHRILSDYGWHYFLNLVRTELGAPSKEGDCMPVLVRGAFGECVKKLQIRLNEWGFALEVDGSFGPATLTAVKQFQERNGLEVDGSVGPLTWGKLLDDIKPAEPEPPYVVRLSESLDIYAGPGDNSAKTPLTAEKGAYTIVKKQNGAGSVKGWGELKSGAGWINLDRVEII